MSTNYHDPWVNDVTYYEAANMNVPLGQFDERITELALGIYDIGGMFNNVPTSSEVILRFPLPRTVTFPENMGDSKIMADVAATDTTVLSLKKDGAEFAVATFNAGSSSGLFNGVLTVFDAGEVLTIVCPSSPDATLANIGWCLVASRIVLVP